MSTARTVERFPLNEACHGMLCLEFQLQDLTPTLTHTYTHFNPCVQSVTHFRTSLLIGFYIKVLTPGDRHTLSQISFTYTHRPYRDPSSHPLF